MPVLRPFLTISRLRLRQFDRISLATERGNDSFLPFLCFDFHLIVSLCTFDYDCNRMYNKTSRSVGLIQPLDHRGLNLNKRGVLTTDSYYNNSNCQSNTTHKNKLFGSIFVSFRARVTTRLEGSWATELDISDSSSKAYPSSSHNLCNRARIKSSSIW